MGADERGAAVSWERKMDDKDLRKHMEDLRKMLRDTDTEEDVIVGLVRKTPEVAGVVSAMSRSNLFVEAVIYQRMRVAAELAELGADVKLEVPGSLVQGNALNVARSPEDAEWLLGLGVQVERNLEQNIQKRKSPYNNPAIMAVMHNEPQMVSYWLAKQEELFAGDKAYIAELYQAVVEMISAMNQVNMLEHIIGDDRMYEILKDIYAKVSTLPISMQFKSIKLYQSALRKIADERLQGRKKELNQILNQRKKALK